MAYMYIKPVQKSEADKIDVFFSILMHIDKVVTSYNYLQFKLPKKKKWPYIEKMLITTTICDLNNETTTQQLQ